MIVDMVRGNIFECSYRHIAFAVNSEGYNDAGFAGQVSSNDWPELANIGQKTLGDVLSKEVEGRTYHALVCHSLRGDCWKRTPETVTKCLDSLKTPDDEIIGVVLMGAGMVGQICGADVFANIGGMARSNKKVAVYTL